MKLKMSFMFQERTEPFVENTDPPFSPTLNSVTIYNFFSDTEFCNNLQFEEDKAH